ncbi:MAG TPA: PepSY domain-containing protein, partial [Vicinamibacterales bacterium]
GMPQLSPDLRRERLAALDTAAITMSPSEAAERATATEVQRATLITVLGRPAYRFGGRTVFADTGEVLAPVDRAAAQSIAARFLSVPDSDIAFMHEVTEPDQWTLTLSRALPLLKFQARDDTGTELYVSPRTAEVVLATTRRDRLLAWTGVIPHWLYFAPLRLNQPLWYSVVVYLSEAACVVALLGLVVGIMRFKPTTPLRVLASIPYAGWMRWHYISGAVFGVFTLTWAFSGLLSMEPFAWTNATGLEFERDVMTGGPLDVTRFPKADPTVWAAIAGERAIKEIELTRIQDEPYYVVRLARKALSMRRERLHQPYPIVGRAEADRLLVSASTMKVRREPFSVESLVQRLQDGAPNVAVVEQAVLTEYDDYYYSRRNQTPLPVLRVKFDDPMQTWVYVDPTMSQVLAAIHRLNRVERWFYNGLHSLDFAFWYKSWLWDVGVILLCLGGLMTSAIGTVIGFGRVARGVRNAVRWLPQASPSLPTPSPSDYPQPHGRDS